MTADYLPFCLALALVAGVLVVDLLAILAARSGGAEDGA